MLGLVYLLWVGLAIFAGYMIAMGGTERRAARVLLGILFGAVLVLLPHWDVVLGLSTMRELCAAQSGVRSKESSKFPLSSVMVVSFDGPKSLCLSCYRILITGAARETYAEIIVPEKPHGLIDRSGIARYWLSFVGDPACAAFERKFSPSDARELWGHAGVVYDGKSCIASERVTTPRAEFEVTYPITTVARHGVVVVRLRQISLRRTNERDPLATLTHLMQLPWNWRVLSTQAGLPPAPACPSFKQPITIDNFAPDVLLAILSGQRRREEVFK